MEKEGSTCTITCHIQDREIKCHLCDGEGVKRLQCAPYALECSACKGTGKLNVQKEQVRIYPAWYQCRDPYYPSSCSSAKENDYNK